MSSRYLCHLIASTTRRYDLRDANNISIVRVNNNYFMSKVFPSIITEWNKHGLSMRN